MSQSVVHTILGADLATSGTITLSYPSGKTRGDFLNASGHYVMIGQDKYSEPDGASFAFNATTIVITYRGATTQPMGTDVYVNLDEPGGNYLADVEAVLPENVAKASLVTIDLGSPDVADPDGISASQAVGAAALALINGALAVGGVATFDVPRNVVGAWTNASVVTVVGRDADGNLMSEASASGTSLAGKKAFKEVIAVHSSASITGATFGSGDVLGLPVWLPGAGHILKEIQDGAAATAGTAVGGLATGIVSTDTTADVRGTYDPNAACDGSKAFKLVALVEDPTFKGNSQYLNEDIYNYL